MAFVVPALAAVGGGSAVAGGIAIAGLAAGAYSALQTRQAGQAQKAQLQAQAKTEAVAAQQREIERRRNLIRALASQNAMAGAAGITTDGSVGAIARADINNAQNDLLYDTANSVSRQRALRSQASNAGRIANANSAVTLLDTVDKGYKALG